MEITIEKEILSTEEFLAIDHGQETETFVKNASLAFWLNKLSSILRSFSLSSSSSPQQSIFASTLSSLHQTVKACEQRKFMFVIAGEDGSGKSHLLNSLCLSKNEAIERGISKELLNRLPFPSRRGSEKRTKYSHLATWAPTTFSIIVHLKPNGKERNLPIPSIEPHDQMVVVPSTDSLLLVASKLEEFQQGKTKMIRQWERVHYVEVSGPWSWPEPLRNVSICDFVDTTESEPTSVIDHAHAFLWTSSRTMSPLDLLQLKKLGFFQRSIGTPILINVIMSLFEQDGSELTREVCRSWQRIYDRQGHFGQGEQDEEKRQSIDLANTLRQSIMCSKFNETTIRLVQQRSFALGLFGIENQRDPILLQIANGCSKFLLEDTFVSAMSIVHLIDSIHFPHSTPPLKICSSCIPTELKLPLENVMAPPMTRFLAAGSPIVNLATFQNNALVFVDDIRKSYLNHVYRLIALKLGHMVRYPEAEYSTTTTTSSINQNLCEQILNGERFFMPFILALILQEEFCHDNWIKAAYDSEARQIADKLTALWVRKRSEKDKEFSPLFEQCHAVLKSTSDALPTKRMEAQKALKKVERERANQLRSLYDSFCDQWTSEISPLLTNLLILSNNFLKRMEKTIDAFLSSPFLDLKKAPHLHLELENMKQKIFIEGNLKQRLFSSKMNNLSSSTTTCDCPCFSNHRLTLPTFTNRSSVPLPPNCYSISISVDSELKGEGISIGKSGDMPQLSIRIPLKVNELLTVEPNDSEMKRNGSLPSLTPVFVHWQRPWSTDESLFDRLNGDDSIQKGLPIVYFHFVLAKDVPFFSETLFPPAENLVEPRLAIHRHVLIQISSDSFDDWPDLALAEVARRICNHYHLDLFFYYRLPSSSSSLVLREVHSSIHYSLFTTYNKIATGLLLMKEDTPTKAIFTLAPFPKNVSTQGCEFKDGPDALEKYLAFAKIFPPPIMLYNLAALRWSYLFDFSFSTSWSKEAKDIFYAGGKEVVICSCWNYEYLLREKSAKRRAETDAHEEEGKKKEKIDETNEGEKK